MHEAACYDTTSFPPQLIHAERQAGAWRLDSQERVDDRHCSPFITTRLAQNSGKPIDHFGGTEDTGSDGASN